MKNYNVTVSNQSSEKFEKWKKARKLNNNDGFDLLMWMIKED